MSEGLDVEAKGSLKNSVTGVDVRIGERSKVSGCVIGNHVIIEAGFV